jgi:predicted nucleotide-binding protein
MDVSEARALLEAAGLDIKAEGRLGNDTGTQLRLKNGGIVNIFDNGNFNVQGKNKAAVEAALQGPTPTAVEAKAKYTMKRKVFVVYGHDQTSRIQLEVMLRRWDLEPLILDQAHSSDKRHLSGRSRSGLPGTSTQHPADGPPHGGAGARRPPCSRWPRWPSASPSCWPDRRSA